MAGDPSLRESIMIDDDIRALRQNADAIYTTVAALPVIAKSSREQASIMLRATLDETAEIKALFDRVRHRIPKRDVPFPGIFGWEECGSALEGACSLRFQISMLIRADDDSTGEWMDHPYGWDFQLLAKIATDEADELLRDGVSDEIPRTEVLKLEDISTQALDYRMKVMRHPRPVKITGKKQWFSRSAIEAWMTDQDTKTK